MKKRYALSFFAMIFLLVLLGVLNALIGSVPFSEGGLWRRVVLNIRLPRIIASCLLGGALSVSGFLLQTFFSNPIAGPYILGISSGAKLFVALAMIFLLGLGVSISSVGMVLAAFLGSMLSLFVVLLFSFKVRNMSALVVCGIMVGYICSAATDFCVAFASDSNIVNLHNWSMGSFSGIGWREVRIIAVVVFAGVLGSFLISKPAGAYLLGENYARSMGVNITRLRVCLILLSSLLSASVTAFAGPISFVGIASPHLMRGLFKTSKPIVLVPGCFLGGAAITLFCDGIARTLFAPTEISVSSVTAVLLVPVVIYMMIKGKHND